VKAQLLSKMAPAMAAGELGVALLCDRDGTVRQILRDDFDLASLVPVGAGVTDLADAGVREKAQRFLAALQSPHAVVDWEITVPVQGVLVPLHWAGVVTADGLVILVARTRSGLARPSDEFARTDLDQAVATGAVVDIIETVSAQHAERDDGLYEDLTRLNNELANLQRELAKKNAQLERAIVQKDQLLGMVAHDLRNPLGVISGYAEFLADEAAEKLSPDQLEFVAMIKESSGFMLHLIDDLLDITAIEAGHLRLDLAPMRLSTLLQRNVALNSVLAEKKEIRLLLKIVNEVGDVRLDGGKIQQVLNNLLSNACKYSVPGTEVEVRLYRQGDEAVVAITDQGQGIPADELPSLFTPFQTTSVRGTAGETSTGLGLAIARKIVAGHGGRIWVESEVGRGSTFSFSLPLQARSPAD